MKGTTVFMIWLFSSGERRLWGVSLSGCLHEGEEVREEGSPANQHRPDRGAHGQVGICSVCKQGWVDSEHAKSPRLSLCRKLFSIVTNDLPPEAKQWKNMNHFGNSYCNIFHIRGYSTSKFLHQCLTGSVLVVWWYFEFSSSALWKDLVVLNIQRPVYKLTYFIFPRPSLM